jgi:dinuclear metal center YbgI/SA1388 family protein
MKIRNVTDYLHDLFPPALQESYDNSGFLIGDAEENLSGVLVSLDITPEVILEAEDNHCNLIVSHHPLIFSPLKKITACGDVEKMVMDLVRKHMSVYALHTNLDNISGGVSWALAEKLGLRGIQTLAPRKGMLAKLVTFCPINAAEKVRQAIFEAGAGVIGNYDSCSFSTEGTGSFRANDAANPYVGEKNQMHFEQEVRIETVFPVFRQNAVIGALLNAHPYEEVAYDVYALENPWNSVGSGVYGRLEAPLSPDVFSAFVRKTLQAQHVRFCRGLAGKDIENVAVCGGAGAFLIGDAISKGADAFVTADIKYHDFRNAEGKIWLMDAGHFETEQCALEIITKALSEKFSNFAVRISQSNANPIHYL